MRQLLKALMGVSGAALFNAVAAMLVGVVTARLLGPAGHGEINFYLTLASSAALVVNLGSGTALRVLARGNPQPEAASSFVGLSLVMGVAGGAFVPAVVALMRPGQVTWGLLLGLGALGVLTVAARQLQEYLQAYGAVLASVNNVGVGHIARLIATALLALVAVYDVGAAMWALCLGTAAQAVAAVRVAVQRGFMVPWGLDAGSVQLLLAAGMRSMGFGLGLMAMQRASRLMIVPLAGEASAGLYVAASTLAESVRMLSMSAGQLLFVRVSGGGENSDTRRFVAAVMAIQVMAGGVLWLLAPWLVHTLYGEAFRGATSLLRGLIVAEMFMGLALVDSRVLMGRGAVGTVSAATVGAAVAAVIGYAVLIPESGAVGAVVAATVAYAGYAILLRIALSQFKESHEN